MLRLLIAAMLGLSVVPAVAAPTQGTVVRRATLLVYDLDKSIAFYTLLGFDTWYDGKGGTVTGQGLPVAGVKPGDPTRLVIMRGRDPYVGMVGLLQYGPRRPLPATGTMRTGDAILMIETTGLIEKAVRLKAAGHRVTKEPTTSRVTSVDGAWDARFMYVFDPDGRMVELTERIN